MKSIHLAVAVVISCALTQAASGAVYTYRYDGFLTSVTNAPFDSGDAFSITFTYDSDQPFSQSPGFFIDAFDFSALIDNSETLDFSSANDAFIDDAAPLNGSDRISVTGFVDDASFPVGATGFFGSYSFVVEDADGGLLQSLSLPAGIDFSLVDSATFFLGFDYFDDGGVFQMGALNATLTDSTLVSVVPVPAALLLLLSGLLTLTATTRQR